ncbi:hypothetical protein [Nostoc sp.]
MSLNIEGALYLSVHYVVSFKGRKFLSLNGKVDMRSRHFTKRDR